MRCASRKNCLYLPTDGTALNHLACVRDLPQICLTLPAPVTTAPPTLH